MVVAGAGISVSAGIPDFRSSTGLFKTLKREHGLKSSGKDLFDAAVYKDADSTTTFHAMIRNLATATRTAEATPFHHLLATLAQEGRLLRLYTQNVDGIDTSLPPLATQIPLPKKGPWPKTVQLHGTLEHMTCTKCNRISEFDADLFDGPTPPSCRHCEEADGIRTQHAGKRSHGIGVLRPRMVLYNEHNPDDEAIGSVVKADMRTRPDALIVVGTTLKVPGVKRIVKEMTQIVRDRRDGVTVWINNDPPPALKDYDWDLVVRGPCDGVAAHAAMRKWDEPEEECHLVSEEDVEKVKREKGLSQVVITSPSKKNKTMERVQGIMTPAASPKMKPARSPTKAAPIPAPMLAKTVKGAKKKQTTLGAKRKAENTKPATKPTAVISKKAPATKAAAARRKTMTTTNNRTKKTAEPIKLNFKTSKNMQPISIKKDASVPPSKPLREVKPAPVVEIPLPMQPLSPSSSRNNGSPPYAPQYFSPKAPSYSPISSPHRAPPYSPIPMPLSSPLKAKMPAYRGVRNSLATSPVDSRKATSSTQDEWETWEVKQHRVVTPPSAPRGMYDLLHSPTTPTRP